MSDSGPTAVRLDAGTHRWCVCARACGVCPAAEACAGEPFELPRARALGVCRCGRTQTPPECDGSHAAGRPSLLRRLARRLLR